MLKALDVGGISIHAPHAGSDLDAVTTPPEPVISIHAPHAGSDGFHGRLDAAHRDFNPRSPCGERRLFSCLPLPPVISIHAPHAGSDDDDGTEYKEVIISIHAPHAGSDEPDAFGARMAV